MNSDLRLLPNQNSAQAAIRMFSRECNDGHSPSGRDGETLRAHFTDEHHRPISFLFHRLTLSHTLFQQQEKKKSKKKIELSKNLGMNVKEIRKKQSLQIEEESG